MVKELPRKCVSEVCAKVLPLAQEPYHQFYPLFESEEDIRNTLSWTMQDDDARAYGYWHERVLEGMCCLFVEDEKKYVLIIALYAWGDFRVAANAFMRRIEAEFSGYTINAAIAGEHTRFATKLVRSGFVIEDDQFDMRRALSASEVMPVPHEEELSLIAGTPLGDYAALHDIWFPDCGWRKEDLEWSPDRWFAVTARRDGEIMGAVFVVFVAKMAIIYAFRAVDQAMASALLSAAVKHSSARADEFDTMMCMAQRTDETFMRAASELGFANTAHFMYYKRKA